MSLTFSRKKHLLSPRGVLQIRGSQPQIFLKNQGISDENPSPFFSCFSLLALVGCGKSPKSPEEICVEAQITVFDQAEKGTKQREYFDTAFKSRDTYNAWAWRECMKKK